MSAASRLDQWRYSFIQRFVRLPVPDHLPARLDRHRIFVLPTGFGYFFGLLLFAMLMGGLNYNNSMAMLLTFLLSGTALLAMLHTFRNLNGIEIVSTHAAPCFAGEVANFVVRLQAPKDRPRVAIQATYGNNGHWISLAAGASENVSLPIPTDRRGWQSVQRIKLFTRYPLGVFYAWSWLHPATRILVYPTPELRAPPLPAHGGTSSGLRHERGDEDLAGLRDYRQGDALRVIAWKATARRGELLSKELESPRAEQIWLHWDATAGLDIEQRLSRLTAWALEADRRGVQYGLTLPGIDLKPDAGSAHLNQILRELALFP